MESKNPMLESASTPTKGGRADCRRKRGTDFPTRYDQSPPVPALAVRILVRSGHLLTASSCALAAAVIQPSEARAESINWFTVGAGMPNATEVLFMAFLMVHHASTKADLMQWAVEILLEEPRAAELGSRWFPSAGVAGWKGGRGVTPPLWKPVQAAYKAVWSEDLLDQIGVAMQAWKGEARCEGLRAGNLKRHRVQAKGVKLNPKDKEAPPRWRTGAICQVAALVKQQYAALKAALLVDAADASASTHAQQLAGVQEQLKAKESELVTERSRLQEVQKEARSAREAHRLAAKRLKGKNHAVTLARRDERQKLVQRLREAKAGMSEANKRKLADACAAAAKRIGEQTQADFDKRLAAARERARKCEGDAKAAPKLRKRTLRAEMDVRELREALDKAKDSLRQVSEPTSPRTICKSSRRGDKGRFQAECWRLRWLKLAQLGRRTPPSAVGRNIADVISVFAPHERYAESSDAESRALRAELTISGEAMAAFQVADSVQVKSFGFDETTKYHDSVLSSNTQILRRDGKVVDVVLRGAFLIPGGTAKEVAEAVDKKLMRHGRRLLQQWKDEHEALHGLGSWERDGGASPEGIGMHRLSEHTLLMSDTCNAARCAKRLLGTMAIDAAVERIGKDRWEAMGEVERGEKCANYQGDCYQHLRNILIGALSDGATNHLKDELADSLEDFSSFDRMSTDAMDLIRAIYKELHKVCSSTVQYSTVQYSTVQYSTVQYSTVRSTTTISSHTGR